MRKMYWKSHCYWGGSGNPIEVCWVDAVIEKKQEEPAWVVMIFWFLTWMQVTCERRFMVWSFVYTLSSPFSSMPRQKNQSGCVSCKLLLSVILAAFHCQSLALAASTRDSLSLWRHSVWKRRVWARNQVFFFFFSLSSILHQTSLGRSQQMSECDFSWDYWIIGQVCLRPHFMQDWGAFVITDIYISVFFLSFFLLKKTQLYPCIIDIRKVYSLFRNMYLHPYKHLYNQDDADNECINHPTVFLCPLIIPSFSPSLSTPSMLIYP